MEDQIEKNHVWYDLPYLGVRFATVCIIFSKLIFSLKSER